ncbi:vancomycin high temperature exclusion protein [Bizionia argentinensis JUB59]|uniref:Vancomycin high temperature exclusion protein n=1 Tax=Bizionia argentinensis JUB59 TaxID=1046627 RepID=G2EG20_9FLAO|nr:ElyC/SanA/YdcF family protein [Bizionia argentinensis]EGV42580.1 vancomycin high temperature exclusion protein [Bizionia argentinensis JUB59]
MKKRLTIILLFIIVAPIVMVLISHFSIELNAENKTFSNVSEISKNKVGVVLGTSKRLKTGEINPYFQYRIDATVKLFQNNKIDFILVSGDNGTKYYDEPRDFKNELLARGIPEENIFLDHAGFRTLDSVVRAQKIFGQNSFTVISQKFHNERAIYIAEHHGIKVIGFNAKDVPGRSGMKVKIREYFARTKVFLDIIMDVSPKHSGKKIDIK